MLQQGTEVFFREEKKEEENTNFAANWEHK